MNCRTVDAVKMIASLLENGSVSRGECSSITRLKFPVTGTHPRKLPQKVLPRVSALTGLLGGSDLKRISFKCRAPCQRMTQQCVDDEWHSERSRQQPVGCRRKLSPKG